MKKPFVVGLMVFALIASATAQSNPPPSAPANPQPTSSGAPSGFVLQDSVPVKLRINRTISSADARTGDQVDFEVLEEVRVNGTLVAPKGGTALGTVTQAQAKRRMARGGKLDINIDYLRLLDGEKAALRAVKETKGGGHTGGMTAGIVATGLIVWPAAPFFLFMHGKDISIPKGTEITAYINGDMPLDLVKFQQTQPAPSSSLPQPAAVPAALSQQAVQLEVTSTPSGADIEIDGNFVGSTPSTVGVVPGQHQLVVKKSGFNPWEKKVAVSSGQVKIDATLEAESK